VGFGPSQLSAKNGYGKLRRYLLSLYLRPYN
jgi:hypothetical protein